MSSETSTLGSSSAVRHIGRVKWFNNKQGYGFITVVKMMDGGDKVGTDIFVHHSRIVVSNEQYKFLVQGEYVEFELEKTTGGAHEYQAGEVSGISGGQLMCETRRETRQARPSSSSQGDEKDGEVVEESQVEIPRPQSVRPPATESSGSPWTLVTDKKEQKPRAPRTQGASSGRGAGRGSSTGRSAGRGRGRSSA